MVPEIHFAPMESIGSSVYRTLHAQMFGGVDRYFIPFVTPTREPRFTPRQLREISREANATINAVPQLLTRKLEDFVWAANALADMGYSEVNLNLGCPAGTVVAGGKGSAMLRDLYKLEEFLTGIFSANLPIAVSVKTRIGWTRTTEFSDLVHLFKKFPIKELTIHPRLKTEQYKGVIHTNIFAVAYEQISTPLGYNGDVVTVDDYAKVLKHFPKLNSVMIGRALIADPALARKIRGGQPASREEIMEFSSTLFENYASLWGNRKNAIMRLKEYWWFFANLFEDSHRAVKAVLKAKTEKEFIEATKAFNDLPLREHATFGWFKAL